MAGLRQGRALGAIMGLSIAVSTHAFQPAGCLMPSSRLLHWRPRAAAVGTRGGRAATGSRPGFVLRPAGASAALKMSAAAKVDWAKELATDHPANNVSPHIANLVGRDLHLNKDHPLGIIKDKIEAYFKERDPTFECKDSLYPIVTKQQCFDDLLIPPDHVSRKPSDTYAKAMCSWRHACIQDICGVLPLHKLTCLLTGTTWTTHVCCARTRLHTRRSCSRAAAPSSSAPATVCVYVLHVYVVMCAPPPIHQHTMSQQAQT